MKCKTCVHYGQYQMITGGAYSYSGQIYCLNCQEWNKPQDNYEPIPHPESQYCECREPFPSIVNSCKRCCKPLPPKEFLKETRQACHTFSPKEDWKKGKCEECRWEGMLCVTGFCNYTPKEERIEELNIKSFCITDTVDRAEKMVMVYKINELIQAVNKLRRNNEQIPDLLMNEDSALNIFFLFIIGICILAIFLWLNDYMLYNFYDALEMGLGICK